MKLENVQICCHFGLPLDLGRLPLVRTGRPDRSVRKWYGSVRRTGSGQTGPALGVGPASSLAPARNVESAANFRARFRVRCHISFDRNFVKKYIVENIRMAAAFSVASTSETIGKYTRLAFL